MKIDLLEVCGSPVLAGALNGRTALGRLLEATATEAGAPEPVFLDFSGIEVATASFLRESVLTFRDIVRGRHSHYYPIVANPDELVQDELIELLKPRGGVLMTCILADDGTVTNPVPLGELDPKQRMTFDLVLQRGETDAGALMREFGESERVKHTTAWNNRLASLAALGLVIEQSQGRAKRYRPLFEGT